MRAERCALTALHIAAPAAIPEKSTARIESAQDRWRAVNAPELVALVRAGARFGGGKLIERPDEHASHQPRRGSRSRGLDNCSAIDLNDLQLVIAQRA